MIAGRAVFEWRRHPAAQGNQGVRQCTCYYPVKLDNWLQRMSIRLRVCWQMCARAHSHLSTDAWVEPVFLSLACGVRHIFAVGQEWKK